jgi:hypothetical protein|tara:strand:+ start:123 stop:1379 length:1257 start_codon:yes stop_codon:yes gene_type:complete
LTKIYLFLLLTALLPVFSFAQTEISTNKDALSVYLDCRGCSSSYVQTEIAFVNFVRDQSDADVHLFVTIQGTGSGGREHTLNYIGKGSYEEESQVIKFISPESDTDDERRTKLVKHVKLGLIGFLGQSNILSDLDVIFNGSLTDTELIPNEDKWNSWVFELRANTNFSGEQSQQNFSLGGSFEAQRITDKWKIRLDYNQDYRSRTFHSTDDDGNKEKDVFITESQRFFGLVARSLSDHWTVGAYQRIRSSTQDNIDLSIGVTPSIEYSLFPYREFTRREVTVRYGILGSLYQYTEPTIFQKTEEFLWRQELSIRMDFTQPWGSINGNINAGNYMNDFSKNRVYFGSRFNIRIVRGFSVFFSARYSLINDQIALPAGETTEEELLLNLRQQATSYNYGGSIGFEFNFGSVYNNVINPRF